MKSQRLRDEQLTCCVVWRWSCQASAGDVVRIGHRESAAKGYSSRFQDFVR